MKYFKPEIVFKDPKDLIPYARNAKTHPKDQIDRIAKQINDIGFTVPIVVDKDAIIISGHGRREAAISLGMREVPVVYAAHLNENQVMAARIADNKVSESGWDLPVLAFDLGTLNMNNIELDSTGFTQEEAAEILKKFNAEIPPETLGEAPAVETKMEVKAGSIWSIGNNLLICDEASQVTVQFDPEVCAQIIEEAKAMGETVRQIK